MKKIAILMLILAQVLVVIGFWAWDHINHPLGNMLTGPVVGQYLAYGRLAGLMVALVILLQLLMIGRVAWIEQIFGLDQLSRIHHVTGFSLIIFLLAHPLLVTAGHAMQAEVGLVAQFLDFIKTWDDILPALIGVVILLVAVMGSLAIVRRCVSFEAWHGLHFLLYLAIALIIGHQLVLGHDLTGNPLFLIYWCGLYLFVLGNLLVYRIGRPLWNYRVHRFRVARLVPESADVTSVYIEGRAMNRFRMEGGQFVLVRFLARGFRWQAHPFSLSMPPNGETVRLTIKQLGDYTRQIPQLKPGTPVIIDGPHGIFTARRTTSAKVLLIAGGIGITPIRAMAGRLLEAGRDVLLLYANRNAAGVVFRNEIEELTAAFPARFKVVYVMSDEPSWPGEKGFLDAERMTRLVPDLKERDAYLCGPPPMMKKVRIILRQQGAKRIFYERFSL